MQLISMFTRVIAVTVAVFGFVGSALAAPAVCPDRYTKMVIPQPAGGVGDIIGRMLAEKVGQILEQPMVVENRPGASTTIGIAIVAKAKPDGCTNLQLTATGVVASVMRKDLPYDLERDLTPVIEIGSLPMVLAVPATSKIQSFSDFKAAAKTADGLNYSTGGSGTMAHLASLQILKAVGGKGTHVPYKGNAPALQGLLAGDVQFMFPSTAEALPLMQGGKLRVLGVTSDKRLPTFPNVPTMKELGLSDFTPRLWYVFLVPTDTPPEAVSRLYDAFAKALTDPSIQQRLTAAGFATEVKRSPEAAAFIKAEAARWKKVVQENNIKSED